MSDDYRDKSVDSYVAAVMCDLVESLTRLEDSVSDMRVRLVRAEMLGLLSGVIEAKKYAREVRQQLDSLGRVVVSILDEETDKARKSNVTPITPGITG